MNTKACNKPFFTHESELENRIQCVVLRRGLIAQALIVLLIFGPTSAFRLVIDLSVKATSSKVLTCELYSKHIQNIL